MEYLAILVFFLVLSFFLESKFKIYLYQSRRERFFIPATFFLIGILWDSFGVYRGHWYFNYMNLSGIRIGILPIEEYLFFLIVPYTILTIYKILKKEI